MPSSTFFRLPEEKRQRLLDAARDEFRRVPFDDVSINRIVQGAHIPRGSFYQYFEDKLDLFYYLMGDMREYFFQILLKILDDTKGNLFAVPVRAFDHFLDESGRADPVLSQCIEIMQINEGVGTACLFDGETELLPDVICDRLDLSDYRRTDRVFISHIFFLTIMPLAHGIMGTLKMPHLRQQQRAILQEQVEIIQYGSVKTKPGFAPEEQGGAKC